MTIRGVISLEPQDCTAVCYPKRELPPQAYHAGLFQDQGPRTMTSSPSECHPALANLTNLTWNPQMSGGM